MNPVKIRQSMEDGLADVRWANERLNSFFAERERLAGKTDQPILLPKSMLLRPFNTGAMRRGSW